MTSPQSPQYQREQSGRDDQPHADCVKAGFHPLQGGEGFAIIARARGYITAEVSQFKVNVRKQRLHVRVYGFAVVPQQIYKAIRRFGCGFAHD